MFAFHQPPPCGNDFANWAHGHGHGEEFLRLEVNEAKTEELELSSQTVARLPNGLPTVLHHSILFSFLQLLFGLFVEHCCRNNERKKEAECNGKLTQGNHDVSAECNGKLTEENRHNVSAKWSNFSQLPDEIILKIIHHVIFPTNPNPYDLSTVKQLVVLSSTCKSFWSIANDPSVWKELCKNHRITRTNEGGWRECYTKKFAQLSLVKQKRKSSSQTTLNTSPHIDGESRVWVQQRCEAIIQALEQPMLFFSVCFFSLCGFLFLYLCVLVLCLYACFVLIIVKMTNWVMSMTKIMSWVGKIVFGLS